MYEFMRENEGLIERIKKWKQSGIYMSNIIDVYHLPKDTSLLRGNYFSF